MKKSEWTGERLETFIYDENTAEHLHRYALAQRLTADKVVLDIASGEGYGSNLIAESARKVFGVDIDKSAVKAARDKYKRENLEFFEGGADAIPLPDNSIEIVISFETLEHHDKHQEMMSEIKRVLKSDGVLLISTPDKRIYSDIKNFNNPFHVKELYLSEFTLLINQYFTNIKVWSQNFYVGSLICSHEKRPIKPAFEHFEGDFTSINVVNSIEEGRYHLILASDGNLPLLPTYSFFDNRKWSEKILQEMRESFEQFYEQTPSFRVGRIILFPFKKIKNLIFK